MAGIKDPGEPLESLEEWNCIPQLPAHSVTEAWRDLERGSYYFQVPLRLARVH